MRCLACIAAKTWPRHPISYDRAGARRYLIRIETSNPELYAALHPEPMSWHTRVECLRNLKKAGYNAGHGRDGGPARPDAARPGSDVMFFRDVKADMIGEAGRGQAGHDEHLRRASARQVPASEPRQAPKWGREAWAPSSRSPARPPPTSGRRCTPNANKNSHMKSMFDLCTAMNALLRITMGNVNISATTALQAIIPTGREIALERGANVVMPILTPTQYRESYQLYEGKPCITDTAVQCRRCLDMRLHSAASADFTRSGGRGAQQGAAAAIGAAGAARGQRVAGAAASSARLCAGARRAGRVVASPLRPAAAVACRGAAVKAAAAAGEGAGGGAASPAAWLRRWSGRPRVMEQAHKYNVSPVLLLNVKSKGLPEAQAAAMLEQVAGVLDPSKQIPRMSLDLASTPLHERSNITSAFVKEGAVRSSRYGAPLPGCLPRWSLGRNAMLLMVIPMDAETPGGRLLRPQAQVMEEAIRHWATVLSVRLDLDAARGKLGPEAREMERQRFGGVIAMMEKNDGPTLVVTDSQAIDVVHPWTLDRASGRSLVPITTFSIAMAYQQNGGRLDPFVEGLEALETLKEGDRVLISEACNHNRITSACNDIGMVQIPNKLEAALGGKKLQIEHAFGREFPELESGGMNGLKLAIHCGGCMIDAQKMQQRMKDLHEAGVPVTNYGVFFSWAAWPDALRRALEPWGVEPPGAPPPRPPPHRPPLAACKLATWGVDAWVEERR
ncbi:hypothetical protein HXX76_011905 [Chlamydomonas incerta]|uniref:Hydrogen maturase F tetramerization domain-containing protein n=1 Tax=Chlamydomonas incerta TaxID=51695 RepID=A0A835VW12_CHLIN|nr:hypothetical protein HXX76_011905 [Chlamydomonas incerta]|eukprot:KAG2427918.1 hypothetical protein HXX76_011905 [Chlamydomonas incerta]